MCLSSLILNDCSFCLMNTSILFYINHNTKTHKKISSREFRNDIMLSSVRVRPCWENQYHRLSRWFVFRPIRARFRHWSLKTRRKSHNCNIIFYQPQGLIPVFPAYISRLTTDRCPHGRIHFFSTLYMVTLLLHILS